MKARRVHAVLAAGVHDPMLIDRWRKDPKLLLALGIEPTSLDLAALWKFSGLTAKVRHNGLRQRLPMTFRLLHVAGLEIEVFGSYAAYCSEHGLRYATTIEGRTRDLVGFLEGWLDTGRTSHSVLWDLIRHEEALARLTGPAPVVDAGRATGESSGAHLPPSENCLPAVRGEIILHEMRCDPRAVESALRRRESRWNQAAPKTRHLCYWRSSGTEAIQILELDEFGYYLLSLVDGDRSVTVLNRALGGGPRPTRGFLDALDQLAAVGILRFERDPASIRS